MEQSKQDTIATLYALRGGLSVLSEISDEANELKEEIDELQAQIEKMEEKKKICEQKLSDVEKNYSELIEDTNYDIKELEEDIKKAKLEVKRCEKSAKTEKITKILFRVCLTVSIIFIIPSLAFCSSANDSDLAFAGMVSWYVIFFGLLPISLIAKFVNSCCAKDCHYRLYKAKKQLDELENSLESCQEEYYDLIQNKGNNMSEIKESLRAKHIEFQEIINEYINKIKEKHTIIQKAIESFNTMRQAMQEQFSEFIDERDWGNVDLIIFNYETGRALDLRDALIQVDNERRKDELVDAIDDACARLSERVSRGFGALQGAIDEKFGMLGSKISSCSEQMLKSSTEQTKLLGERLGQIADSAAIQEALLRNIDTSSAEMAESLENMREIANESYYEGKYNT